MRNYKHDAPLNLDPEPAAPSSAVLIRPLRPTVAARTGERLSSFNLNQRHASLDQHRASLDQHRANLNQHRASLGPAAKALARDPRAYPTAPPRIAGAVQRTYTTEPEPHLVQPYQPQPADPRYRAAFSVRASAMRPSQRMVHQRRSQLAGEDI